MFFLVWRYDAQKYLIIRVEIEGQGFHLCKKAIDIHNVNTDKKIFPDKFSCSKKSSKYFLAKKIMKNLCHSVPCSQKVKIM